MANDKEHKWEDMTLGSLEAQLRRLGKVKIPKALKGKLFERIPVDRTVNVQGHRILCWPKVCRFGLAIAAVLILALILIPHYSPSVSSRNVIADINDRPISNSLADQNNAIVDMNYIGYDGQRLHLLSKE